MPTLTEHAICLHFDSSFKHLLRKMNLLAKVIVISVFTTQTVFAVDWVFTPSITLGLNYSDNINLATPGNETSDHVVQVTPAITATYQGPRFEADINYQVQALYFRDDSDLDSTYHRLAAEATGWLVPESFSLDGLMSVRQQVVDPTQPIPTSTISGGGNLTDERTAYLSPRWQIRFSDRVQADIRYAVSKTDYEDDSLEDNTRDAVAAALESTEQQDHLYWAAKYRKSEVDFDSQEDVSFEHTTLEVGIPIASRTRFVVLVGDEVNTFRLFNGDDAPDDSFWMAGIRSSRAGRYELELLAGDRVFGDTYSFRWVQQGRRWSTEALYSEDYVTYAETRLDIDPSAPESILPGTDLTGVTSEVYLRERAQLGATLERPKTTLRVSVYDEDRLYQTTNNQESLKGIELVLNWRAGALTTFSFSGGLQENELIGTNATDELKLYSLGVERRFGPRVVGGVSLRRTDQSSDDPTREYVENVATISATATF